MMNLELFWTLWWLCSVNQILTSTNSAMSAVRLPARLPANLEYPQERVNEMIQSELDDTWSSSPSQLSCIENLSRMEGEKINMEIIINN